MIEESTLAEEFSVADIDENVAYDDAIDTSSILDAPEPVDDGSPKVEVIGVRFKKVGKVYYFAPEGLTVKKGEHVIVDTARGYRP